MDIFDWTEFGQFLYITGFDKTDVENCVNGAVFTVNWHAKGTFTLTPSYNGSYSVTLRAQKTNPFSGAVTDLGTVTIASGIALTSGVPASFAFDEGLTGSTVALYENEFLFFYLHLFLFYLLALQSLEARIKVFLFKLELAMEKKLKRQHVI
jgi:hypothetical protein